MKVRMLGPAAAPVRILLPRSRKDQRELRRLVASGEVDVEMRGFGKRRKRAK